MTTPFHVVTVGWDPSLVEGMLDRVQNRTDIRFSHIVIARRELAAFKNGRTRTDVHLVRPDARAALPTADAELLLSLERPDVPTVHNMILADRVVRELPYEEGLRYATCLANRFAELFTTLKPSVVIGGFDSLHAGIALAVARKLGIPWFAMYFTTLPQRLCGFCTGMTPDTVVPVHEWS